MTAPCPPCSDLVLGLSSDDEDEEDEPYATPDDSSGSSSSGGDVGAEGLSTTPSTSSESGSSSLEARRSPPLPRVGKRSLRGELLERWPGWTSPARKRLRSASPEAVSSPASLPWPMTPPHPSSPSSVAGGAGLLVREYDRFWKLVEKIASSSPNLVRADDDCERLCRGHGSGATIARTASTPSSSSRGRARSPRSSLRASRGSTPTPTPDSSSGEDTLQFVILAVPDEVLDDEFDILPPPSPFSEERTRATHEGVYERVTTPRPPPAPRPPDGKPPDVVPDAPVNAYLLAESSQRQQRDEMLERLQTLAGRPLSGAEETDKVDVEEDSSVLQLLVLTPTEERKVGPAPTGVLGAAGGPGRPQRKTWGTSLCRRVIRCLVQIKFPYFLIILGIIQVSLFAAPTPYGAQELKNMFVWDSSHMFKEPWRTVSYAMLHSGQMHVALNVGVQTFVGTSLEREQGACRVAGVYFGGALYGALVTGVAHPALLMVGASAGIYSLLMSHLAQIWMNMDSVRYGKTRAGAVLLLTSADMVYTAHHAIKRGNAAPRIGVTAHCAGAISGLFLGLVLYHTVPDPGHAHGHGHAQDHAHSRTCCCFRMRSLYRAASAASGIVLAATAAFCLVWVYLVQITALDT